ncbi:MAG: CBS domain-containing protein [Betaproteobacteria bacterium]|jgi:CBS domain-containing protein|nr:CBS domain-containing protein [Betaproteobacteria bacterium]NBS40337.1 CBS domain-containing protein [Betaproteobacteria bacterium]NBY54393.1 CBS domain-containing protein [Betaproteobacteria bacterium]NCY08549.1 CBS domain-containing protein [Betaproteobacteria bacterium]NDC86768.1 CBS domain-containing protein [Betaproteobacteria bacterium]
MITLGAMIKSTGRGIFSVGSQQTVFEALQFMADKNIGAVLVIDDGVLAGIFSERDYARKVVLEGRSSQTTLVRDVMVSSLITIEAHEPLDRCMQLMTDNRIRHLPVLASGQLIGVISIGDVVRQMIIEQRQLIEQLEAYIRG